MIRFAPLLAALILTLQALIYPAQAQASPQVWGVAIGIDRYQAQGGSLSDLRGAVNDARDIAAALREAGAADVTLLVDEAAHRDAVFATIRDTARRASPGDSIVISYAGHGGQEPTDDLARNPDGMMQVTLLGSFRPEAPHNYQRIFDHEWRALVRELSDYTVILLNDSCHSGTANRTIALPGAVSSVRFAQYGKITDDQIPPARRAEGPEPAVLEHEVYLGATLDDLVVPEIELGGQWRGALSYVFAQALRGHANHADNAVLTRGALVDFVQANVRTLSSARQFPQIVYPDFGTSRGDDQPLFSRQIIAAAEPQTVDQCTAAAMRSQPETLSVHVTPHIAETVAALRGLPDVTFEDKVEDAGLILMPHPSQPKVMAYGPTGDLAAELPIHAGRPMSVEDAQALVARWRLSGTLDQVTTCAPPLAARLTGPRGEGALHQRGEQVKLSVGLKDEAHLTIIVVNGTGAVELLYPLPGDDQRINTPQPWEIDFVVTAPHGTDLLMILASDSTASSLHRQIRQFDQRSPSDHSLRLLEALADTLPRGQHRVAVLPVHTTARSQD